MPKTINFNVDEIEKFSNVILNLVEKDKIGYIDAIIEYCQTIDLEFDVAAKLISPLIKSKIAEEAQQNNLMEKMPTLHMM